jgi:hypothetical protein
LELFGLASNPPNPPTKCEDGSSIQDFQKIKRNLVEKMSFKHTLPNHKKRIKKRFHMHFKLFILEFKIIFPNILLSTFSMNCEFSARDFGFFLMVHQF